MKTTLSALLILTSFSIYSQTRRISHKSHSGKARTYNAFGNDNFGLPSLKLDSVLRVSNKKTITFSHYPYKNAKTIIDTIKVNCYLNNPLVPLDSLKKMYPDVKFIGYDSVPRQKKIKITKNPKK